MLLAKGKIGKVVMLRPGALGDVLAARGAVRFCKLAFPGSEVALVAPGERGRFLQREGWADRAFDWERAAFGWLFGRDESEPPAALRALFAGTGLVVAYLDFQRPADARAFAERLEVLTPASGKIHSPSRPPPGRHGGVPIGDWLREAVAGFCRRFSLLAADSLPAADDRIPVAPPPASEIPFRRYVVMHPGSGAVRKNWPLANFSRLARLLAERGIYDGLVVTSGEADADLGRELAASAPGALLFADRSLEALAGVLAHASLYVGNDSGVSHLAAAVAAADGRRPRVVTIFGPSDPSVWAPPGALVLAAGADMSGMDPSLALRAIFPDTPG